MSESRLTGGGILRGAAVAAVALALASCGKSAPSSQVVVTGKDFEITAAELDQLLRQATPQPADKVAQARREILNALIDEKLLADAAVKAGLDKNTGTVQSIEAARRGILAQAYVQTIVGGRAAPDDPAIQAFYNKNRPLYAERQRYHLQEVTMPVAQAGDATAATLDKIGFDALVDQLRQQGKAPVVIDTMILSDQFGGQRMPVGSNVFYTAGDELHLGKITGVDPVPLSLDQARADIVQRLNEQQAHDVITATAARLRKERDVQVVNKDLKPASS